MGAHPSDAQRLARGSWPVLLASFLGWLFDGYELGLFSLLARPALRSMLGVTSGDGEIGKWMGTITACFLVGAAFGGVVFGWLGDRIGRVRAMSLSILVYSLVSGLGYFAQTPGELGIIRFVSALGMGGQWSLGVALVMEYWPEKWRPALAGAMGAAANLGSMCVGVTARLKPVTPESWRWMMLVAAAPALLVVFIFFCVPESERWKAAVRRFPQSNPLLEIFGPRMWKSTVVGIALASVALVGTWGSVQWLPLWADQMAGASNPAAKADTQVLHGLGAITGACLAPLVASRLGRRRAYFFLCLLSLSVCGVIFRTVNQFGPVFLLMVFVVSASTASFYGWFPLYLPELFPTRARATGQGLCFNSGRLFAAVGALTQGQMVAAFDGSYARAGAVVTLIYVMGMALIWLGPETKGKALPE